MSEFSRISVTEARAIVEQENPVIVDVRDPQSHSAACIDGAVHLNNDNVAQFIEQTNRDTPIIVYCHRGHSSLNAAQLLVEQGFTRVMSIEGGYEAWRD